MHAVQPVGHQARHQRVGFGFIANREMVRVDAGVSSHLHQQLQIILRLRVEWIKCGRLLQCGDCIRLPARLRVEQPQLVARLGPPRRALHRKGEHVGRPVVLAAKRQLLADRKTRRRIIGINRVDPCQHLIGLVVLQLHRMNRRQQAEGFDAVRLPRQRAFDIRNRLIRLAL